MLKVESSKWTLTAKVYLGQRVIFVAANGEREYKHIDHIWDMSRAGLGPPMVNLEGGPTSVPHKTAVEGARGFF